MKTKDWTTETHNLSTGKIIQFSKDGITVKVIGDHVDDLAARIKKAILIQCAERQLDYLQTEVLIKSFELSVIKDEMKKTTWKKAGRVISWVLSTALVTGYLTYLLLKNGY